MLASKQKGGYQYLDDANLKSVPWNSPKTIGSAQTDNEGKAYQQKVNYLPASELKVSPI